MKYVAKRIGKNIYFKRHLGLEICQNVWSFIDECKVFKNKKEANYFIKKYKLKNVELIKL